VSYEDILDTALDLGPDRAALAAFLRTLPPDQRSQVEADLQLRARVEREFQAVEPAPRARVLAERQLLAVVAERAAARKAGRRGLPLLGAWPRLRLVAALTATAAALVLAVAVSGRLDFNSSTAEAVVVEGTLAEIGPGVLTLNTTRASETVRLEGDWQIEDGFGNQIDVSSLRPGQVIVLTARRSDNVLIAENLTVKGKLFGLITSVGSDRITVQSGDTTYLVLISGDTEIEGRLVEGAFVEIEVDTRPDGSLWAEEIEIEDDDEDEGGDDDHENEGSSGPVATVSAPASGGFPQTPPTTTTATPRPAATPGGSSEDDDPGDDGSTADSSSGSSGGTSAGDPSEDDEDSHDGDEEGEEDEDHEDEEHEEEDE
jgi:hypothetical protein